MNLPDYQKPHRINQKSLVQSYLQIPKQFLESRTSVFKWIDKQKEQSQRGINCFWVVLLTFLQIENYDLCFTKILQNQTNQQKDQELSEDNLSADSSVNMRQRKVSFGLINPKPINNENQNKRKRRTNNIFVVEAINQHKQIQLQKRQEIFNTLLKKIKTMAYQYAHRKELYKRKLQDRNHQLSMSIMKTFSFLFPKQLVRVKQLFQSQKEGFNLIIQLLSTENISSSEKDHKRDQTKSLIRTLSIVTQQKILSKQINNQNNGIRNIESLLKYFKFEEGKDYELIELPNQQNSPIGINFQNGLFNIASIEDGFLLGIDIDRLQSMNEEVKNKVKQVLMNKKQVQRPILSHTTDKQPTSDDPSPINQPTIQSTTPKTFISRYNNRYFKNQRLIYKQRTKLQSRFKQQQVDTSTGKDQYEGGYQILVNSDQNIKRKRTVYENENNQQIVNIENNFISKNLINFKQRQNRPQQILSFDDEIKNLLKNDSNSNILPHNQTITNPQQILQNFYSRNDFQISDNEILDDIQRVLI